MLSSLTVFLTVLILISSIYIPSVLSFQPRRHGYGHVSRTSPGGPANTYTQVSMVMPSSSKFYASDNRKKEAESLINNQIKVSPVRVIDGCATNDAGEPVDEMLGIFPIEEARQMADERDVDLVLINDKGDPPVCKIIDYGKYKYSQERKKKENNKKQSRQEIKEVKMSYKIDQHDFQVRLGRVQSFIGKGDKVKVVVQFKGREMQYKELGRDLLLKLYTPVEDIANIESPPKIEGRSMAMMIGPKQKQNESKKNKA